MPLPSQETTTLSVRLVRDVCRSLLAARTCIGHHGVLLIVLFAAAFRFRVILHLNVLVGFVYILDLLLRRLFLNELVQLPPGDELLSSLSFCTLQVVFVIPGQRVLNDSSCSLLVETDIFSRLCRPCFGNLDLLEILLYSSKLFEDRMFFRLNAVKS